MTVSEIKIFKVKKDDSKVKAFASITIDDCLVLTGIKIITGSKGLFTAMPSQKVGEEYKDIFFPVKAETREKLNDMIIKKYNEVANDNTL